MRTFIAITFPPAIQPQIAATCSALRNYLHTQNAPDCLRWASMDNAHLTLRFLGETTPVQTGALATKFHEIVEKWQPFELTLGGIGVFPNARQPRVLWLGVGGDLVQLNTLQAAVEAAVQAVGFGAEQRPFSAHITLARAQHNATKEQLRVVGDLLLEYTATEHLRFQVNAMVHMQSTLRPNGAIYTPISHFCFR